MLPRTSSAFGAFALGTVSRQEPVDGLEDLVVRKRSAGHPPGQQWQLEVLEGVEQFSRAAGTQLPGHMPLRRTSIWSAMPACRSRLMSSSVSCSRVTGGRSPRRWRRVRISCGGSETWLSVSRRRPAVDWNALTSVLVGTDIFESFSSSSRRPRADLCSSASSSGMRINGSSASRSEVHCAQAEPSCSLNAGDDAVDLLPGRREDLVGRQPGRGVASECGPAVIEPDRSTLRGRSRHATG